MSRHANAAEADYGSPGFEAASHEEEIRAAEDRVAQVISIEALRRARFGGDDVETSAISQEDAYDAEGHPLELGELATPASKLDLTPGAGAGATEDPRTFLNRISKHRILSREEEFSLGVRVQDGLAAAGRLKENDYDSAEAIDADLAALADGDGAKKYFVEHNYKLVQSVMYKHFMPAIRKHGLMDLFDQGVVGATWAVMKFDPHKGLKYSTYATPWIHQSIQRWLENNGDTIRFAVHDHGKRKKIYKLQSEAAGERRTITKEEIVARVKGLTDAKYDEIAAYESYMYSVNSLEAPLGDDGNGNLIDLVASENAWELGFADPDVENEIESSKLLKELQAHLTSEEIAIAKKLMGDENIEPKEKKHLKTLQEKADLPEVASILTKFREQLAA